MLTYVFGIIVAAGILGALCYCVVTGIRNGDRPGDARVTALLTTGTRPGEPRPLIVVTVRNPSGTPVLAALRARRALLPAVLTDSCGVCVPRWTSRRKFRPGKYETVGVAQAGGAAELAVPVAVRARRYVVTAAVGQEGGRLRVHELRLGPVSYATEERQMIMVE